MSMVIQCEKRQERGKNAARRLRGKGLIPAVMYGQGAEAVPLVMGKKDIVQIMKLETGENTVFKVAFEKERHDAMIKELQVDPVTDEILHADLIRISMDKPVKVTVPVVLAGTPVGVKNEGGFVDFVNREVEIECLPKDIPENLVIDISELHIHQSFKAGDIDMGAEIKLLTEPSVVLVLISIPQKAEEFPGEKPEAELEEAAEPEVMKKGKAEEPEEEEEK